VGRQQHVLPVAVVDHGHLLRAEGPGDGHLGVAKSWLVVGLAG